MSLKAGLNLFEKCAKYAKACGEERIMQTIPQKLPKINPEELKFCPNVLKGDVVEFGNVNKILMDKKNLDLGEFCDRKQLQELGIKMPEFVYKYSKREASCFNYLRGYSGKNGNFEIFSYMTYDGELLGRETIYKDKGIRIVKQFNNHKEERFIDTKTYSLDGTLLETSYKNLGIMSDNVWLSLEEIIRPNVQEDVHIIEKLEAGKKKQQVKYNFNWDSDTYANIPVTENQPERFREFLPLFVSESEVNREKLVNYIGRIEEKNLGIQGLVSKPIQIVDDIENDCGGTCNAIGEICLLRKGLARTFFESTNEVILSNISHEMKHRSDFSDMMRMEESFNEFKSMSANEINEIEVATPGAMEFFTNSIKKGIIPKDSPQTALLERLGKEYDDYEELCKTIGHDNLEFEKRAITYENEEKKLFKEFVENLLKFLNFE